ncbi:hypothetical protein [Caldicellulosiruptor bescii]|nr:hypothetical protein [Caldicellulosiruptor bescii]
MKCLYKLRKHVLFNKRRLVSKNSMIEKARSKFRWILLKLPKS